MNVELVNSNSNEVNVSIKDGDIGILYLIQHELLKNKEIDFAGVIMNYVFVNNAEPKTKSVSRSSYTGKSQKLEQYEKQYLSRLEKEPAKEETKKVSRPSKVQSKKPKSASELEKYEKRYLARLEKQSQTNVDSTDEE